MRSLEQVYGTLKKRFGPQGWWPIPSMAGRPGFDAWGYHKGEYAYPRNDSQRFEIVVGAILTQNTSWKNVEKAIGILVARGILDQKKVLRTRKEVLEECLRPVGYFRVKAKRLSAMVEFIEENGGLRDLFSMPLDDLRALLLNVNGVGDETADSILLYAAGKPSFVVDAYTRRILTRTGITDGSFSYGETKRLFEDNLHTDVALFNEYHALLVELAKVHCKKTPICEGCPLNAVCEKRL